MESNTVCDFCGKKKKKVVPYKEKKICNKCLTDEFGYFLAKTQKKYQNEISPLLCLLYDCPEHYERMLRKEKFEVSKAYMSWLCATVPSQIKVHATEDDATSGFFPRMLFVFPERAKERKNLRTLNDKDSEKEIELAQWVADLHTLISKLKAANIELHIEFSPEAMELYNNWCERWEEYLYATDDGKDYAPFFGRTAINTLKFTALFELGQAKWRDISKEIAKTSKVHYIHSPMASQTSLIESIVNVVKVVNVVNVMKEGNNLKVLMDKETMALAIYYSTKLFLPYAKKFLELVRSGSDDEQIERVYQIAVKHARNGVIRHADLLHRAHVKSREFKEIILTLQEAGRLHVSEDKAGKVVYTPLVSELGSNVKMPEVSL